MLKQEENDLLTRVGPGTPGGEMLRRYWQPVALSKEVPAGGAPLPVRLLGEDLVLFRDERGRPGLLGLHCSHRGADLSYGRLEDGGIRCIYHGWLYDVEGRCLEQPGEPSNSWTHSGGRDSADSAGLQTQSGGVETQAAGLAGQAWRRGQDGPAQRQRRLAVRHPAYPCQEVVGVIFAYLGPGEPPLLPDYELFRVPEEHRWIHKYYHECSYLQGNEGNMDPVHPFFLHRFLPGGRLRQTRVPISHDERVTPSYDTATYRPPTVYAEEAPFGVSIYGFYETGGDWKSVRSSHFVMPDTCAVGGGPIPPGDGYLMNWHIPIDDTHHWRYSMAFRRSSPLDPRHAAERASVTTPNYRFIRNLSNRYLQDRDEQRVETYAGMGPIFVVQDNYATETAGPIQDRTREYLAPSDAGIPLARQLLLRAIRDVQEGRDPPHIVRRPEENAQLERLTVMEETIPATMDWETYRRERLHGRQAVAR